MSRVMGLDKSQTAHVDLFTPTANKVLPHCFSVKGLWVDVVWETEKEGGVGVINKEIKRDGAGITRRLIVG